MRVPLIKAEVIRKDVNHPGISRSSVGAKTFNKVIRNTIKHTQKKNNRDLPERAEREPGWLPRVR